MAENTYIYEFGETPVFNYILLVRGKKESLILDSQKQTLRNGNERKRYMLERTSHKIKTQG